MNRTRPATVRPAIVLEALEVNSERTVELGDRAGKNYRSARRILLYDCEPVAGRECSDRADIGRVSPELLREILTAEVGFRAARCDPLDPVCKRGGAAPANDHADLEAFLRIGRSDGPRPWQWLFVAADESMSCHGSRILCAV
jgi:hypothetical protein